MPDIVMQDLYGQEQVYENVTELSLKKTDGGTEWFIERQVDYFVLRETDYEPAGAGVIAASGVGPMFGDGEINLLMVVYMPAEGVSEHPVVALGFIADGVETTCYYVYETLTGADILAVLTTEGTYAGTARPGWNILESVDGVDTLRHIDDPESVAVPILHPYTVVDEAAFYSMLSPMGQENKTVTLTANGTVEIAPEPGGRGLRRVQVTVDVEGGGAAMLQEKAVTLTSNGTTTVTPDEGYDGLSAVTVDVSVADGVILREQTIEGFSYHSYFNAYQCEARPAPYVLVGDREYTVVWDGTEYLCTAFDFVFSATGANCIGLGNTLILNEVDSGEPFTIVYDMTNDVVRYFSSETDASHHIAIKAEDSGLTGIELQEKTVTLTGNGTTVIAPDEGYDGLASVTVDVSVADGSSAAWKSWQMINGQCAVTAEEYEAYFASENNAVMFGVVDISPVGMQGSARISRSVYHPTNGAVQMCFVLPDYQMSYPSGTLGSFSPVTYATVCVEQAETGGYTMRLAHVCMNSNDVTQYFTASAVPQTICAMLAPET